MYDAVHLIRHYGGRDAWWGGVWTLCTTSSSDVDAWLVSSWNPKRDVIEAVRKVVMSDVPMAETIKWRAPAFLHREVMAYFHGGAKDFASLIFPGGSRSVGDFALLSGTRLQHVVRFDTVDAWCSISQTHPPTH